MAENAVTRWFGLEFGRLHPLLQALHRRGGKLRGTIDVEVGRGLAGGVGRRLARRLGVPTHEPRVALEVDIRHQDGALYWGRRFGNGADMVSVFRPVGIWPHGYWTERTGFLDLRLTVDVVRGGWYWRPLSAKAAGVPLPLALFPRSQAYKRIEDGKYFFCVQFTMPLIGDVLRYGGTLDAELA
jgi:hypothetical protein